MFVCFETVWVDAFHDGEDGRVRLLLGDSVSARDLPHRCLGNGRRRGVKRAKMSGKFFHINVEASLPRWVGTRGECNGGVKVGLLKGC